MENTEEKDDTQKVTLDLELLHKAKVQLLTTYCDTCLDKHLMEKILLCCFKEGLFNYAMNNGKTEDAEQHYIDLCRLLNIKDGKTCCENTKAGYCERCHSCQNGCCKL